MAEFCAGSHNFVCRRMKQRNSGKSIYMGGLLARKGSTLEFWPILNVREEGSDQPVDATHVSSVSAGVANSIPTTFTISRCVPLLDSSRWRAHRDADQADAANDGLRTVFCSEREGIRK